MKKIQFNKNSLTRTVVKNNIVKIWNQALPEEQVDWYDEAFRYAVRLSNDLLIQGHLKPFDNGLNKTIGVLAALSPMKRWETNKWMAKEFIETGKTGHMPTFIQKSQRIMLSEGDDETILAILNGKKIMSFYLNIRYPERTDSVTIDRHALSIGVGEWLKDDQKLSMSPKQYEFFEETYKYTAEILKVSPLHLQGVTWMAWRRLKSNYESKR